MLTASKLCPSPWADGGDGITVGTELGTDDGLGKVTDPEGEGEEDGLGEFTAPEGGGEEDELG